MSRDADLLKEIRERYAYAKAAWREIRDEAAKDMRYVAGDPWDDADKTARKNRPTVAPEEMGQYFNQVINNLRANPRGMRFTPRGNGASEEGARFYQNKAREVEYRSHAKFAYITAAENAIQRSYGFVGLTTDYTSPRSANQDIVIRAFPDPDVVLPDPDALRADSSDMRYCFVLQWDEQSEFKRQRDPKVSNFHDFSANYPDWIQGTKILQAEYWRIETQSRTLVLFQPPAPQPPEGQYQIAPPQVPAPQPLQVFADELPKVKRQYRGGKVLRELRAVDYPAVVMYLTNGLEVLSKHDWPGKYIPIVSCYGKVLYVPEGGQIKRKILSMTRFGRDPWKSYCYACSQELEVLAQVPKVPVWVPRGSMNAAELQALEESYYSPKAYVTYDAFPAAYGGDKAVPPPQRIEYAQGAFLQGIEVVKEGYRRAIQAAMGSNFLPTEAQKRNQKSGVALDKIDQAATTGTFHFVDHYDDMVRRVAEIFEDLCDKVYDFAGETAIQEADGTARTVAINQPGVKDAVDTAGDYGVTVSTGPSSDSEHEAAEQFVDNSLLGNVANIAPIVGPKIMQAILAKAIRLRNLGPIGDQIADLIEPPELKQKDGQPVDPALMAAQAQIQRLEQELQKAGFIIQTKQVEGQLKFEIVKYQTDAASRDKEADRETKLAIATLQAKFETMQNAMALFFAERERLGLQAADAQAARVDRVHDSLEKAKDRTHERVMADVAHAQALDQADQAHQQALEQGDQQIGGQLAVQDNAPQPDAGASA